MNLSKLSPFLLHHFKSEHDLIQAIEEISVKFTKDRSKIEDYLKDPRLVSAYTAFYLTTNMPKLSSVFQWLPSEWLNELKECDFIDLGAGPGTFSMAWEEWGGSELSGKVIQIETSPMMREQAAKIWKGIHPNKSLQQLTRWQPSVSTDSKFLLFGHSANEMGAFEALNYIESIKPEHILFIEPGTKAFFTQMLEIREVLIREGYEVLYPCPKMHECPMAQSSEDWCHQFIHVQQDSEIERISQMAKKDRRNLPLTVHAYSKNNAYKPASERLVRVHPSTKFSFEWDVCNGDLINRYQIMKRNFDKNTVKSLENVLSGASLESELEKNLEKSKRVNLKKLNNSPLGS